VGKLDRGFSLFYETSKSFFVCMLAKRSLSICIADKYWKCKVEEKRENFSPRKLRKPGEREGENFCWKVTFSRENFSPEITLKYDFSWRKHYFAPDEHDNYWAQARRQP
jgi:hypothetical protein